MLSTLKNWLNDLYRVDQPDCIWVDLPNRPGFAAPESRFCRVQIGGPRAAFGLYYKRVISSSIYNGLYCRHQLSPLAPSKMVHFVTLRFHLWREYWANIGESESSKTVDNFIISYWKTRKINFWRRHMNFVVLVHRCISNMNDLLSQGKWQEGERLR